MWPYGIAQRKRCHVNWIRLYPILGLVSYDLPYSKLDHAIIAWGGVLAQSVITVPVLLYLSIFGAPQSGAFNVALGIWGYLSLGLIAFNLIPVPPLDGATAWKLIPELAKRMWTKSKKREEKNPYRFRGY